MKKILTLGDFNVGLEKQKSFWAEVNYNFTSLIKQPRCYQNLGSPDIYLILSNVLTTFKRTSVIETELSFSFNDINCHEKDL